MATADLALASVARPRAGRAATRTLRVLFMPAPAVGHVFPMVPLAWAFRAAGHEVICVTGGDGLGVSQAGIPVLDALPGRTTRDLYEQFCRDVPELFAPPDGDPVAVLNDRKASIVAAWDPYVDEHVAVAERVGADLVVYDPIFGVGPLVAAKLGIPAAALGFTICRYGPEVLREATAVTFERHGLEVPGAIPTIDLAPPSLVEPPPSRLRMRYVPYNGSIVLPDWILEPPTRPRVAVSFGSLEEAHGSGSLARLAAAADGVDAEFLNASAKPAWLSPAELPPNVRIVGWIPLNALLATCAASIHHGGSGSALTCCALGVPQMALPEGLPDAAAEAELLRVRGAALVLDGDALDAPALQELLADAELRRVAGELRAEIAALPAPAEVVAQLAELAKERP
jgi:UDP:flavonoid glycosyltransferase YjiC (YdhE family)